MTNNWFRFRHFRTRILVFVLSLLLIVQLAIFFAVNLASTRNAVFQIDQALVLTQGIFQDALATRKKQLLEKIRLLSSDYAFKKTFASGDVETIMSVLENHRARVGADVMMLLAFEGGDIIADTSNPESRHQTFACPELLDQAFENEQGESSGIKISKGVPYQFVLVPLFTPEPSAWIVIGFEIGDQFAGQLQEATQTHVSILSGSGIGTKIYASTLPQVHREDLEKHWSESLDTQNWENSETHSIHLQQEPYVSLRLNINEDNTTPIYALLQRPLNEALAAYLGVRKTFGYVFVLALLASIIGVLVIARSVTRPVKALATSAKRIEEGDYSQSVEIQQRDELGKLANSFNQMVKGLAERRRVRSLLGKVVSPEIADELLKKDIELGGEEREVSVLFSDVRNFTSLCEGRAPKDILELLNRYLTRVSDVIEDHQGVIDKYIGDAVMALFGAPIQREDDAVRAVLAALEMCTALDDINVELKADNKPLLAVGVGINTDVVVAGNMGSKARLNYTVIGDGVNLASRLEGLTKQYGVNIIVSESTKNCCPTITFRELDKVRVKGKSEPVIIYEPMGLTEQLDESTRQNLRQYHAALLLYRDQSWECALEAFKALLLTAGSAKLYQVYCERIEQFQRQAPPSNWDGTYTYTTK